MDKNRDDMADERAAFEAWASKCGYDLERHPSNAERYWEFHTNSTWTAWQAARASSPNAAVPNDAPSTTRSTYEYRDTGALESGDMQ